MFSGPPVVPPAHLRVQILRAADHGCQPAPGLPCALFTEEGQGNEQDSGISSRENADLCVIELKKMVLPDRIELSTSPLPMECSTTELRQHVLGSESAATGGLPSGPISATSPPPVQACSTRQNEKFGPISGPKCSFSRETAGLPPIWRSDIPGQLASCRGLSDSIHFAFRTIGSRGPLELSPFGGILPPTTDMDRQWLTIPTRARDRRSRPATTG